MIANMGVTRLFVFLLCLQTAFAPRKTRRQGPTKPPIPHSVKINNRAKVSCMRPLRIDESATWYKQNDDIIGTVGLSSTSNSVTRQWINKAKITEVSRRLFVLEVNITDFPDDYSEYKCVISKGLLQPQVVETYRIIVVVPLEELLLVNMDNKAKVGKHLEIESGQILALEAVLDPIPRLPVSYKWTLDGKIIQNTDASIVQVRIDPKHNFKILNCEAYTEYSRTSVKTTIVLQSKVTNLPPRPRLPTSITQKRLLGDRVELSCIASDRTGGIINYEITQYMRNQKVRVVKKNTIIVDRADFRQNGVYKCLTTTERGFQGEANITIHSETFEIRDHTDFEIIDTAGKNIVLYVSFLSLENVETTWTVDDEVITASRDMAISHDVEMATIVVNQRQVKLPMHTAQLIIYEASRVHDGIYECHITDSRGQLSQIIYDTEVIIEDSTGGSSEEVSTEAGHTEDLTGNETGGVSTPALIGSIIGAVVGAILLTVLIFVVFGRRRCSCRCCRKSKVRYVDGSKTIPVSRLNPAFTPDSFDDFKRKDSVYEELNENYVHPEKHYGRLGELPKTPVAVANEYLDLPQSPVAPDYTDVLPDITTDTQYHVLDDNKDQAPPVENGGYHTLENAVPVAENSGYHTLENKPPVSEDVGYHTTENTDSHPATDTPETPREDDAIKDYYEHPGLISEPPDYLDVISADSQIQQEELDTAM